MKYATVTHNQIQIKTVGEFIRTRGGQGATSLVTGITAKQLVDFTDDNGVTNRQRIFERYSQQEEQDNQNVAEENLLLKLGTVLNIPNKNLNKDVIFTVSNRVVENYNIRSFMAAQLHALLTDTRYFSIYESGSVASGAVRFEDIEVSVFMWVRALGSGSEGSFIDISEYVTNCSTTVTKEGGNFQITLAPLAAELTPEGWKIKEGSIFNPRQAGNSGGLSETNLHQIRGNVSTNQDELKRNSFFFHNIINTNDLVFIRFETLDLETKRRARNTQTKGNISSFDLFGSTFDMIGLVDNNTIAMSAQTNEVGINISGRDLMKVLLTDGAYFFPLAFAQGMFYNTLDAQSGSIQRSIATGNLITLNAYIEKSIQFALEFVFTQLSTSGLVPNSVFDGYPAGQRVSYLRETITKDANGKTIKTGDTTEQLASGVWQIINLLIDEQISDRLIIDSSIAQEQGAILNAVKKICQEPFVEFYGDTYGDKYYFTARKPPFDEQGVTGMLYNSVETEQTQKPQIASFNGVRRNDANSTLIDIEDISVNSESLSFDDTEVYTWYQLTPQGLLWGTGSQIAFAFLPAVYFPELNEIWGSRPLSMVSNYVKFKDYDTTRAEQQQNFFEKQGYADLKFMIDSNIYLPFTRKGTLVLEGDRRIKRGTFIRYKPTGEIFYVDSVSNEYSVDNSTLDRTTTLQVSRGMVERYIRGVYIQGIRERVSYFNIANTTLNFKEQPTRTGGSTIDKKPESVLTNFKINSEVLNFFVKRMQFHV